jgi:hypothetical protein
VVCAALTTTDGDGDVVADGGPEHAARSSALNTSLRIISG